MRPLLLLLPALAFGATDWSSLLDQGAGKRVHFGAELGGAESYRRNESEAFAPASTSKLLTAGAVLDALGPTYRFATLLQWTEPSPGTASSLTLRGSGDPSWGLAEKNEGLRDRLDQLAAALKGAGITTVEGTPQVAASDARWSTVRIPEGWKSDDTVSCDGALAQAFNFAANCGTLRVTSPTHAAWDEPGLAYPVRLSIASGTSTSLTVAFTGSAFEVSGTWKSRSAAKTFRLPVYDTLPWAAALFRAALEAKGIRIVPGAARGGASKQLVFFSDPLSELLKPFLKNSVNLMGDAFLKELGSGARSGGPDLLETGLARAEAFLRRYGDTRDLALHDGSGLSRTSRVTPSLLYAYLSRASAESWFPAMYAALPVAGVDGTLRNRMKGTAAEGVLRGKTGTLEGVYNLAGYVPHGSGYAAFVLLTSTTADLESAAKDAEDRVGARLAALHFDPARLVEKTAPYPFVPEHAGRDAQ